MIMNTRAIIFSLAAVLALTSCGNAKKVAYFQDANDSTDFVVAKFDKIRFQPDDKLVIIVNSRDANLTNLFNLPYITQRIGSSAEASYNYSQGVCGYTIDSKGNIDFPVLGNIHIAGLTRNEVEDHIKNLLVSNQLVQDPVVTCDYMNLHVSVMGEVMKPGRYNIDHDSYTITDALAAAGDLQIFAKRDNIKVMRTVNGVQKTYEVDLTSDEKLLSSPVYYLQQNDIVYVSPNDMRSRQSTVNGNNVLSTSFWISIASLAATIMTAVSVLLR